MTDVAAIEVRTRVRAPRTASYLLAASGMGSFRLTVDGEVRAADDLVLPDGADVVEGMMRPPQLVTQLELAAGEEVDVVVRHDRSAATVFADVEVPIVGLQLNLEVDGDDDDELREAVAAGHRVVSLPGPSAALAGSDTVYLTVVDRDGMVVSLINTLFITFGVAICTEKTGIMLTNRGACFVLDPDHPNATLWNPAHASIEEAGSVAGVTRRTTRRVIRRSTVYVTALPRGCVRTSVNGAVVWRCGPTYYQAYGGRYVVVYIN